MRKEIMEMSESFHKLQDFYIKLLDQKKDEVVKIQTTVNDLISISKNMEDVQEYELKEYLKTKEEKENES